MYRHRLPRLFGPALAPVAGLQPTALTGPERAHALHILNSDRFADKSPAQVWAVLLDEGAYLASISTLYRILRACDQVRERRSQARHPPRVRPELVATGPDKVWSWSGGRGHRSAPAPADPGVTVSRHRALVVLIPQNAEVHCQCANIRGY